MAHTVKEIWDLSALMEGPVMHIIHSANEMVNTWAKKERWERWKAYKNKLCVGALPPFLRFLFSSLQRWFLPFTYSINLLYCIILLLFTFLTWLFQKRLLPIRKKCWLMWLWHIEFLVGRVETKLGECKNNQISVI